jgi:hypothetical protein
MVSGDAIDPIAILNAGVRFERLVLLRASEGPTQPPRKRPVTIAVSKPAKSNRKKSKSE